MASNVQSLQVALPISECIQIVEETGIGLGYKLKTKIDNYIKFKVGGAWDFKSGVSYNLEITCAPLGDDKTDLMVKTSAFGLFDTLDILGSGVRTFIAAYKNNVMKKIALQKEFKCPKCKKIVPQGSAFCPDDGQAVARFCPKCGVINALKSNFCAFCGFEITD